MPRKPTPACADYPKDGLDFFGPGVTKGEDRAYFTTERREQLQAICDTCPFSVYAGDGSCRGWAENERFGFWDGVVASE